MTPKTSKLLLHAASAITLVMSACWLASDHSWEPALALFTALCTYVVAMHNLLKSEFERGAAGQMSRLALSGNDSDLNQAIPTALLSLADSTASPGTGPQHIAAGVLAILFKRLGVLAENGGDIAQPTSERAAAFLRSMADSAENSFSFAGNWTAKGKQNSEAIHLGEILEKIEQHRISQSGGLAKAKPMRSIASSLVLVKSTCAGIPVFLLRWSDAWGGYYWFVGGIQEPGESAEDCAARELREEIGIDTFAIQSLPQVATAKDRRISGRQQVLTEYTYNLFSVGLDEHHDSCKKLICTQPSIPKTVGGGYSITQKCKWHTWDEIKASPELARDAQEIIKAIEHLGIKKIPMSVECEIA